MITINHPWVFAFGLLGNVISFMVYLAPLPTFIRVYKKKSTEAFQSLPYVVAIFSSMLWIYYALLKGNAVLLITINVAGVIIETLYIAVFITYAPRQAKISTLKLLLFMNIGGFSAIVLLCHYFIHGVTQVQVFGWVCVVISISVFAAPLSVIRLVIRTKSVEFMPFNLSFCLTLTAIVWGMYGMLQKDLYITLPNLVGLVFGIAQMSLYGFYRKYDKAAAKKQKLPEQVEIGSPVKESNNVEIVQPRDQNIIAPQQQQQQQQQQEAVVVVDIESAINREDSDHQEENHNNNWNGPTSHGPSTTCNVNAENIVGGPEGPAHVQLVQCAV